MTNQLPTLLTPGSLVIHSEKTNSSIKSNEVPIKYITAWIRTKMPEFGSFSPSPKTRILIIRAETGSGKSTTLPVAIFRILRSENTPAKQKYTGPGVICTQPRVLTTISLANDVSSRSWNPDMILGETVGFHTGPLSNKSTSGLLYATSGVLAAQLKNQEDDEIVARYRFIIVDEAHERTLDNDLTLMMLRNFYLRNSNNRQLPFLILTSATFNPRQYADYFNIGYSNIIEVTGRQYPIKTIWPETGTNDYPAEAAVIAVKIHEENLEDLPTSSDILIFMPGRAETILVYKALNDVILRYKTTKQLPFLILIVNSDVVKSQSGDYPLIFEASKYLPRVNGVAPVRRIIISTVVAETGLTIDTLKYVIDHGWYRTKELYQPFNAEGILTRPATKSRIEQRKGRVGRLFPGEFYPLYTKKIYEALDDQQMPDIISIGVSDIYLSIICEQQRQKIKTSVPPEFRVEDMGLLDPPSPEAILVANSTAISLGFVSVRAPLPKSWPPNELTQAIIANPNIKPLELARGYGLTSLGHIASMFTRIPMEGVRILLAGYIWNVAASDLITIVAMFGISMPDLLISRGRVKKGATPGALPPGAMALKAALPPFLLMRIGGGVTGVLPPTESEAFYFRTKLLLADDFAEAVLIFDAFMTQINNSQGNIEFVYNWCTEIDLNFDIMLEITYRRESIIENMIVAGINPFRASARRLSILSIDEFAEGVRSVKQCLYSGLRNQVLKWTPDHPLGASYISAQGLRVQTPKLFTDAMASRLKALHITQGPCDDMRPQWILTDKIRLLPAPKRDEDAGPPLLYVADTNLVSILDGYVTPDMDFNSTRSYDVC